MTARKLKLELDSLKVQSFAADDGSGARKGTVRGHDEASFCRCDTRSCDVDTASPNVCTDECGYTHLCGPWQV